MRIDNYAARTGRLDRVIGITNRYRDNIARANGYSGYTDRRVWNGLTGLSQIGGNLSATRSVYMGLRFAIGGGQITTTITRYAC